MTIQNKDYDNDDEDKGSSSNRSEEALARDADETEEPSLADTANNNNIGDELEDEDTNNNNSNSNDIWGTGEGYTPLAAWAQAGGGNGLFSMGPSSAMDSDDDDHNDAEGGVIGGGGTFFANLQAFAVAASHSSDNDEEEEEEGDADQMNGYKAVVNSKRQDEGTSFRDVAGQALLALEEDYRLTLQDEKSSFPSFANEKILSSSSLQARQSMSADHNNDEEEEDVAKDLPTSFAADFDAARSAPTASSIMDTVDEDNNIEFAADFSSLPTLPEIDAEKVRMAVQNLQVSPKFQKQIAAWERQQQRLANVPPLHHPWIPDNVCRTFRKAAAAAGQQQQSTTTTTSTTHTLSRAATLAHAFHRLDLISSFQTEHVIVHLLGCDEVEASSCEQLKNTFKPLVTWMQQHARKAPKSMHLHLIGPSLTENISNMELIQDGDDASSSPPLDCRLESVQISVHPGYYHEWRQENTVVMPNLLLTFHPGFWGYDTWKPTLDWLVEKAEKIPLVATSYTLLEAEEDQEVLQALSGATSIWEAEYNPFASQRIRPTATAVEGEEYRENAAWQGWRI